MVTPASLITPATPITPPKPELSSRSYGQRTGAASWEEIWEAGPYYERLSQVLDQAKRYAIFLGWQIDSRLILSSRTHPGETLKAKILRLCERNPDLQVYFLMWDHSYFYCFERETWQGRVWDEVHPNVHFLFDNRHPFGGSHHEKICIVDGRVAFCGGIDLCDERWDTPEHRYEDPRRSLDRRREHHGPYHDMTVQVTGQICVELQNHAAKRWRTISTIPFPDPPKLQPISEKHSVYLSRTLASIDAAEEMFGGGPSEPILREIEFLFRDLIRSAQHRIVLEGQYYWSREINELLIAKIQEMRGRNFEIVIILAELTKLKALTRQMAKHELGLLRKLQQAAIENGVKLRMGTPYVLSKGEAPPKPVYIHSKVMIIDDRFLSVGSANFAARALRIDSEVNLTLEARTATERAHIAQVAQRILDHWEQEHILLKGIQPELDLEKVCSEAGIFHRTLHRLPFPWQAFFDPTVPWLFPLKLKFRRVLRREGWARTAALVGFFVITGALGAALAVTLSSMLTDLPLNAWKIVYCSLLSLSWFCPVPFSVIAVLAAFHFKALGLHPSAAPQVTIAAYWAASLFGYIIVRMFPSPSSYFFGRVAPRRVKETVPQRLGIRTYSALLSVLFDPRVSVRNKIGYQGLYCVPIPWFAMANWVLIPAVVYVALRWLPRLDIELQRYGFLFALTCVEPLVRLTLEIKNLWKKSS